MALAPKSNPQRLRPHAWLAAAVTVLVVAGGVARLRSRAAGEAATVATAPPRSVPSQAATADFAAAPNDAAADVKASTLSSSASEDVVMRGLREELKNRNPSALADLDTVDHRFGRQSPGSEERVFLRAWALVNEQRVGEARAEASRYYKLYGKGPFTQDIVRLTGYSPRPVGPPPHTWQ